MGQMLGKGQVFKILKWNFLTWILHQDARSFLPLKAPVLTFIPSPSCVFNISTRFFLQWVWKNPQQKNSPGPHTPPRCLPLTPFTLKQTPLQVTLLCCLHFPTSYAPKTDSPMFLHHLSEQSLMTSRFYITWALQSLLLRGPLLHPALLSSPPLTALPSLGFCDSILSDFLPTSLASSHPTRSLLFLP